ncbi:hypoxanthine phosphoribosyltransferase, partial [Myxococcota bacterium]|nr:hypoxanthine phosphoribosyltransferase [Myxococcota bacterium]
MSEVNILHISPQQFLEMSFSLGRKLFESGFRPKHTISVWRGGTPVGLGVDAYFRNRGIFMNHTTIATESYTGIGQQSSTVLVKGLEHVINVICREDDLLILDDVYESGRTIEAIVDTLRKRARANCPERIVVGTLHHKPEKQKFSGLPLVTVQELPGDVWIDYPHELADLV